MEYSDEAVFSAAARFSAVRGQGTLKNLLAFGRILKQVGIKVTLSQVIDASRSLEFVDIADKEDFRAVLRSNLISEREGLPIFDRVFDCFWRDRSPEEVSVEVQAETSKNESPEPVGAEESLEQDAEQDSIQESRQNEEEESILMPTYSLSESMSKKDFSES